MGLLLASLFLVKIDVLGSTNLYTCISTSTHQYTKLYTRTRPPIPSVNIYTKLNYQTYLVCFDLFQLLHLHKACINKKSLVSIYSQYRVFEFPVHNVHTPHIWNLYTLPEMRRFLACKGTYANYIRHSGTYIFSKN